MKILATIMEVCLGFGIVVLVGLIWYFCVIEAAFEVFMPVVVGFVASLVACGIVLAVCEIVYWAVNRDV